MKRFLHSLVIILTFSQIIFADSILFWGGGDVPAIYNNIPVGNDFVSVTCADYDAIALRADGTHVAWGSNFYSALNVPEGVLFQDIELTNTFGLGVKDDGSILFWGSGDVPAIYNNIPVGNDFVSVTCADYDAIALRADGTHVAWGSNFYSALNVPEGVLFQDIELTNTFGLGVATPEPTTILLLGLGAVIARKKS